METKEKKKKQNNKNNRQASHFGVAAKAETNSLTQVCVRVSLSSPSLSLSTCLLTDSDRKSAGGRISAARRLTTVGGRVGATVAPEKPP